MQETVDEIVSVGTESDNRGLFPVWVNWNGRTYHIKEIGMRHNKLQGSTMVHIFSVVADSLFLRLSLNAETLVWKLDEIFSC